VSLSRRLAKFIAYLESLPADTRRRQRNLKPAT